MASEHHNDCARVSTDLRHCWIDVGRAWHVGLVQTSDDFENVCEVLFRARGPSEDEITAMRERREEEERKLMLGRGSLGGGDKAAKEPKQEGRVVHQGGTYQRRLTKIGRNDACPCGSGRKFKKCCGKAGS